MNTMIIVFDTDLKIGRQISYRYKDETMLAFTHIEWANILSQQGTSRNRQMKESIEMLLNALSKKAELNSPYIYRCTHLSDNMYHLCVDTTCNRNLEKLLFKANVEISAQIALKTDDIEVEQSTYSNSCYFYHKEERYRISDHELNDWNICDCEHEIITEDGRFDI